MINTKTINKLINETSPYLLQHAHNPVYWYPWGDEAFSKAKAEDKPIFLSIGYSTCHWCHVMERESFENEYIAKLLNDYFISIKVDKEERPDIDSVYMRVCQACTGSGGWPTSIFMSPEQKPFFSGTYFPPGSFTELLYNISRNWTHNRKKLMSGGDEIIRHISESNMYGDAERNLSESAYNSLSRKFDSNYGGFGNAPKFPSPHNLLFLMKYDKKHGSEMAEKTLASMYAGGIFDHIGYGFSRYSTDEKWLVPHFEKMLYDNALLAVSYLYAFEQTENNLYKSVAEKIFIYIEREMTASDGGFYSAQDADSDGIEGKYYLFKQQEIINILGAEAGKRFNNLYDITSDGNLGEMSIPNLIAQNQPCDTMDDFLPAVYNYRKQRTALHRDEKVLASTNSLMLWAYANAYRILGDEKYLSVAKKSQGFIENNLVDNDTVYVSITKGKRGAIGFIDDYAFYIMALVDLYRATYDEKYLLRALELNKTVVKKFWDEENGGFYFYGNNSEKLIIRPKESYDGAIPSGNSVMFRNLDTLYKLTKDMNLYELSQMQKAYMDKAASDYPHGFCFYLYATLPTRDVVCVMKDESDLEKIKGKSNYIIRAYKEPTEKYPLVNDKTTFYICDGQQCFPPTNNL